MAACLSDIVSLNDYINSKTLSFLLISLINLNVVILFSTSCTALFACSHNAVVERYLSNDIKLPINSSIINNRLTKE